MQTFNALTVKTKLLLSYGLLVVLLLLITAVSTFRIMGINDQVTQILDDRFLKVSIATNIDQAVNVQARFLRNAIIGAKDPEEVRSSLERVDKAVAENNASMEKLEKLLNTPKGQALFKTIVDTRAKYGEARKETIRLLKEGKVEESGEYLLKQLRPPQNEFLAAIDAMSSFQSELMAQSGAEAKASGAAAVRMTIILAAAAVLAAIAMTLLMTRNITQQLGGEPNDVVTMANAIAEGDLNVTIEPKQGDSSSIVAAMFRMKNNLSRIVRQVRDSSESISTGSTQIATGNADLSQRTEEQASNLQQTAASMEELSSTVKLNAETTQQASQLANQASEAASKGGKAVNTVVATMQEIATSSQKIADIIGVIDGIAFQTNILALNAAVEAARAGEQGRGFAVVATEVRSLAGRSADAAKEIKSLIHASVERVEAGTRQVDEAGNAMGDIVAQVQRVTGLIEEISNATNEQASGISQVGNAVTQLDQVTQQNAALVEESAAAAESLRHQAAQLMDTVRVFKV